ncbi:UNVERIFIED_CONTAM: DEAD-box ATP-dependent RNA helicase 38 [Sesamum angustifolium]|uniref:RNA helicase n=1 Tax=Sesamum angustifolium TaxID=2727405 RepID=A0AAW2N3L7_9LAMI
MADNESATASTTAQEPSKSTETKRWADVAEEEQDIAEASSNEPKLDSLAIDDSKLGHTTLTDPEDSSIEAVTSGDTPYTSAKRFEDLNLSPELLKGLYVEMKFEKPSKIQAISLPMILTPPNKNLIAQAHNGSGKTTCFVLGMLSRVDPKLTAPQALCICPTRELAIQNMEVLLKMGKFTGITSELAIPADPANYIPIQKRPPITAQVIIGTPGTICKWMLAKKLGMSQMKILVFDEADHMLAESGFRDDSVKIMKAIAKAQFSCQVLLFSATFDDAVRAFVSKIVEEIFVRDYNQMFVKKEELSLESVNSIRCSEAEDRDKIIKEFKEGLTQVLISTDLLARGFDQKQVNLVVNFDLPVRYDRPTELTMKFTCIGLVEQDALDAKVAPWNSEKEFEVALENAGLL